MLTLLKVARDKTMRLLGFLVGLLALGFTWPALADEKFDPKEVRVITPTSATSNCIGNPKTPICAVETFLACRVRKKQELCDLVNIHNESLEGEPSSISYRIMKSHIFTKHEIPKDMEDSTWMKTGYAHVAIKNYSLKLDWCPKGCFVDFSLRPTPSGWEVFESVSEGVD
ncbi:MAG: hypothetical protein HZA67_08290 [Rhodospirillales bacterium]|jgi:hypothetical protein|nr:hypothetical protein [Rhodospirillales bacterium]